MRELRTVTSHIAHHHSSTMSAFKRTRKKVSSVESAALASCFTTERDRRRSCNHCVDGRYSGTTSNENLRYHMHSKHRELAIQLGVRAPKSSEVPPSTSSSSSASTSLISHREFVALDLDDPDPSDIPLSNPTPTIVSLSSSSSSLSSQSSFSSSSLSHDRKRILVSPPPPPPKRPKQQSMETFTTSSSTLQRRGVTTAALDAQIDLWLYEGLSNRLADSSYMRQWLTLYRQGNGELAGRRQIAARAPARAKVIMGEVMVRLRQSKGVTVGIDGWTNVRKEKVINFCPVAGGIAFYYSSAVLKEFSTAEAQHIPVADGLRSIMAAGVLVMALVTDNEAVNKKLYEQFLLPDFPWLLHIPCAAHTVQLCVRAAMKLPNVESVVNSLLGLLLAFRKSKALRVSVKQQQALLRAGRLALQIINVVDTRWNSVLFAAQRILELEFCIKPFITKVIAALAKRPRFKDCTFSEQEFWHPLKTLVHFLIPYQISTDILQSDAASLADVHGQFSQLITNADTLAIPHPLAAMREPLKRIIHSQWEQHINRDAVITCSFLAHDSRYTAFTSLEKHRAGDWFTSWGVEFLHHYHLSDSDNAAAISSLLFAQHSDFAAREGVFSSFNTYQGLDQMPQASHGAAQRARYATVLCIWRRYLNGAAIELATCALALLSVTASEAAVERSFSRQGLIHSKLRNRSYDESVHLQMCFAFNSRALERAALDPALRADRGCTEELPDDDADKGTALLSQLYTDALMAAADESSEDSEEIEEEQTVAEAKKVEEEDSGELSEDSDDEDQDDQDMEGKYDDEEEEEEERLMTDQEFVEWYLTQHHISQGYKFTGPREGQLQAALIDRKMRTQVRDMIAKIRAHLLGKLPPAAGADAAVQ